jgi:FkbM family methyltransferase
VPEGFYIDVGAYLPREDSVTLAFYERGWCGLNVEPNPEPYNQLRAERPRDINVKVALSDKPGVSTMNVFPGTGLSTLEPLVARERSWEGREPIPGMVEVETLGELWARHIPDSRDVHFLKVDVEGHERQVLLGNDWSTHRPWIVVVESTRPQSTEESHHEWEMILTEAGYLFVYGDGLNRFYLANEHQELRDRFRHPPNFFDNFVLAEVFQARSRALAAEAELAGIHASRSWRMTRALRVASRFRKSVRSHPSRLARGPVVAIKSRFSRALVRVMQIALARPRLRRISARVVGRFPRLEALLISLIQRELGAEGSPQDRVTYNIADLSPRAREIHVRLKNAIDRFQ